MKLSKERIIDIAIFLLVAIGSFIFLTNSVFHPWVNGISTGDSAVFETVAMMMEKGFMPYKDSFDHKGPLIYIIDYFGRTINKQNGIFIFEIISMITMLFMMYKISNLFLKKGYALLITFFVSWLLYLYYGNNMPEEFALPCITISIYIFTDYFINNKINKTRLFICGLTFGIVLMLKVNLVGVWFVMCLNVLYKTLKNKEYKELGQFLLWFIGGVLVICLPIIIWLSINGVLGDCINDYLVFNFSYTGSNGTLRNMYRVFEQYCYELTYFASFVIAICYLVYKRDLFSFAYVEYMIFATYTTCMSGHCFSHYAWPLIPICIYPYSRFFGDLYKIDKGKLVVTCATLLLAIRSLVSPEVFNSIVNSYDYYKTKENGTPLSENLQNVVDVIENNSDKNDLISIYGNANCVYIYSDRLHATRYSYFPYIEGEVLENIKDEYFKELKEELPKIIVIRLEKDDDRIDEFLDTNNYKSIYNQSKDKTKEYSVYLLSEGQ